MSAFPEFSAAQQKAQELLQRIEYKTPTPIDEIVKASGLVRITETDFQELFKEYLQEQGKIFTTDAITKVQGAVDLREGLVFIDEGMSEVRQNFVSLHEVGHKILPWQEDLFLDDKYTLDFQTKRKFEREANFVASELLFQGNKFDEEANDSNLSIAAVKRLANKFGSSIHASLRRYVERHHSSCALLVVEPSLQTISNKSAFKILYNITSQKFIQDFGSIETNVISEDTRFFRSLLNINLSPSGILELKTQQHLKEQEFRYFHFGNSYHHFFLLCPVPKVYSRFLKS